MHHDEYVVDAREHRPVRTRLIVLLTIMVLMLGCLAAVADHQWTHPPKPKDLCEQAKTDATDPAVSDSAATDEIRQCWLSLYPS